MKKIIFSLGAAVFLLALFVNTNSMNETNINNGEFSLNSLVKVASATIEAGYYVADGNGGFVRVADNQPTGYWAAFIYNGNAYTIDLSGDLWEEEES